MKRKAVENTPAVAPPMPLTRRTILLDYELELMRMGFSHSTSRLAVDAMLACLNYHTRNMLDVVPEGYVWTKQEK